MLEMQTKVDNQNCTVSFGETEGQSTSGAPNFVDALMSLLGTPEGKTVRRVLADVDMPAFARSLATSEGSELRHKLSDELTSALLDRVRSLRRKFKGASSPPSSKERLSDLPAWHAQSAAVQRKELKRWRRTLRPILGLHSRRIRAQPLTTTFFLAFATLRVLIRSSRGLTATSFRALVQKFRA